MIALQMLLYLVLFTGAVVLIMKDSPIFRHCCSWR